MFILLYFDNLIIFRFGNGEKPARSDNGLLFTVLNVNCFSCISVSYFYNYTI